MASYSGTVESNLRQEEAWSYLADLRTTKEWDPSIVAARLVRGEPGEVGSRYELEVSFVGRTVTLPYETVESERPRRVVFEAHTGSMSIRDEATVWERAGGSGATWEASLRPRGIRRVFEPVLEVAFARLGRRAEEGLRERLAVSAPREERIGSKS
jgi:carbon monoxide dehydrogenase subunit G